MTDATTPGVPGSLNQPVDAEQPQVLEIGQPAGAAIDRIRKGMAVVDAEGTRIGTVASVEGRVIRVEGMDATVPFAAVAGVDADRVRLSASGARVPLVHD